MIEVVSGFKFTDSTDPLDGRNNFPTVADMKACEICDEGHITFCKATGKTYRFVSKNTDGTSKTKDSTYGYWEEFEIIDINTETEKFYNYMSLPHVDIYIHTYYSGGAQLEIYSPQRIELQEVGIHKYIARKSDYPLIQETISLVNSSEVIDQHSTSNVLGTIPRWNFYKENAAAITTSNRTEQNLSEVPWNDINFSAQYFGGLIIPYKFVKDNNNNIYRAIWHNITTSKVNNKYDLVNAPANGGYSQKPIYCTPLNCVTNKPNNC